MTAAQKQLQFRDVDGLAFAAAHGKLDDTMLPETYVAHRLGPLLELMHLFTGGRIPRPGDWLALNGTFPLAGALEQTMESWVSPVQCHAGFIRAARRGPDGDSRLTGFLMNAKRAGREVAGLPAAVSGQLVAGEWKNSKTISTNMPRRPERVSWAYRAERGAFEFVVADRGIGILRSLRRCATYATLSDEGKALEAALTDGVSRYGLNSNHGHGFKHILHRPYEPAR